MNNEKWEDYAIKIVKEQRDSGDLIVSFFLCSAFVEHYSKTKLFIFIMRIRKAELIKVRDKITKKTRNAFIWNKLRKMIWKMSQSRIIELGLLVRAWNHELYTQLLQFNERRNRLVHKYKNLLDILNKDEKEVRNLIDLGLSLLYNIKLGYVDTDSKSYDK